MSFTESQWNRRRQRRFRPQLETLEDRTLLDAAFPEFIDPNPNPGNGFGQLVLPLSTGNVVITSPYDDAGGTDAGAVYLFNGATGALISTLTGSSPNDNIGVGGVTALTNGNYVVISPFWDNGAATDAGAATFGSGITGVSGSISAANSLVGGTTGDQVGFFFDSVTALSNGNFVVTSPFWDNGAATDAGAVTFGSGTSGVSGVVSAANSLVGSTANDFVHRVTELTNGNYVVRSPVWDNGAATDAGAVTFASGTSGVSGTISAANSLVGSASGDRVGDFAVTPLTNGNYVVSTFGWDNGAATDAGAVTFGNGATGVSGTISAANSLIGSTANDFVGVVTGLTNGNYVVSSRSWDNGAATDAGAVTFGSGTGGVSGTISAANSLVGSTANDGVGGFGSVTELANGNYVVSSPFWDNGTATDAGAVTFGSGASGVSGTISAANSLVGSWTFDGVGAVTALPNGNYVVSSSFWDNGTATDAGAVTFGSGTTGVSGTISAANSLVGSSMDDRVGSGGVTALTNGNYVVGSGQWDASPFGGLDAGAATFGSGTLGVSGTISAANSLVGSSPFDRVGAVTALPNGNYVVITVGWQFGNGAVTFGSGISGVSGEISAANSLVGSTANDFAGGGVTALTNGNYVVRSPFWDNGAATDAGAVTFASGTSGISGVVSAANSLVGSTSDDRVGVSVTPLTNGNYVVSSLFWDNGAATNAGAVTFGSGISGVSGVVSAANSLVGSRTDDMDFGRVTALSNGNYVVSSPFWNNAGLLDRAGAVTFGSGILGVRGKITATNSALGGATNAVLSAVVLDDVNGHFFAISSGEGGGRVRVGSQFDGFVGPLSATLDDGQLFLEDTDPAGRNNNLSVRRSGTDLVFTDADDEFQSGAAPPGGTLSDGNHTLTIPLAFVAGLHLATHAGIDTLTVDYSGGEIGLPITIGAAPNRDELVLIGTGMTSATLSSAGPTMANGALETTEGDGVTNTITFTDVGPLTLSGLLSLSVSGPLNVGGQTLAIDAAGFTGLGSVTTLSGGSITAPGGLHLGGSELLLARGTITAPMATDAGSTITLTGDLTLGGATAVDGFVADGRLNVNEHTVTINDANEAVLGSRTVLGTASADGILNAPNGLLMEEGRNLQGRGTIHTSGGDFHNDGHVISTTGVTFKDLVTGIGDFAGPVTFEGGTSFGHSPVRTDVAGNVTFGATNTHAVEIGGLSAGSEFDQLSVNGDVNLNGALDVRFINGFTPSLGESFRIIDKTNSGTVAGTFAGLGEGAAFAAGTVTFQITYQGGTGNDVVLTVVNPGTFQFSMADYSVSENGGTANITVTRNGGSGGAVTVQLTTANGTALAGQDYSDASQTLTFHDGQTSVNVAIPIIDDALDEADEALILRLSNPSGGATLGSPGEAVLTIVDDDPAPVLFIDEATVTEGNSGTAIAVFTVRLGAASGKVVTVTFATADASATSPSDYAAASGTLTFSPGETRQTIAVLVNGDRAGEPDETYFINLTGAANAGIGDGQGVGTIGDDEPRISITDVSNAEGNKRQQTLFTFIVTLSTAYDQPVTMSFGTTNGTATSGSDYAARSGTLTFAPGETTKTITIEVKGDSKREANETFYLDLFGLSSNALVTKNRGLGTILNDD